MDINNYTISQAFDNSDMACCVIKLILDDNGQPYDWEFVYANNSLAKLEGVPKEELIGRRFFDIFPNADNKWFDYYYPAAYENKSFIVDDYSPEIDVHLRIHCYPVSFGYCGCFLEEIKDIHKSMEYNEADTVISGLAKDYDTLWLIKAPQTVSHLYRFKDGKFSTKKLGHNYESGMRNYINTHVYPLDRERIMRETNIELVKEILAEKGIYEVNYRGIVEDRIEYYQMKFASVADCESFVAGVRNVNKIVKEQQKQEEALQEALEKAKQASDAKTAFLSNMSHDIRTPMNAIIGFTNLAISHIDDKAKVESYLNKISSSSEHLLSLINDVLDMSKIESGKMQLFKAECNLSDILYNLNNIIQPEVKEKKLKFFIDTFDLKEEVVIGDELRLNQVLFNLVGNAVKFTPVGGTINVRVLQRESKISEIGIYEFHIRDNGIGMSKEFIERVFLPFEREKTSTVSGIQGTGLGLSIAKSIIDMMDGNIIVNSELGKGTEFIFTIPMEIVKVKQKVETSPADELSSAKEDVLYGKRILVAEDNEMNQEIITEILKEAGIIVEVVLNGKEVIEKIQAQESNYYNMILMDIQMPEMDGYEATQIIRTLDTKELAQIPIIAMTANAFVSDKKKAIEIGMNGHISKPIDIEKLLDMIRSFV